MGNVTHKVPTKAAGFAGNPISQEERPTVKHPGAILAILTGLGIVIAPSHALAATGPAHLLKDINPTQSVDMGSDLRMFHTLGNIALFRAWTPAEGYELWRTDGTESGTFLVRDIWPGPQGGIFFDDPQSGEFPFDPAVLGDQAFFLAEDGVHGWELWRTDGSEAGTRMVKDIRQGPDSPFGRHDTNSGETHLGWAHVESGGLMYFLADDGEHGIEVWRTDGTEAGTFLLKDILPGPQGSFGNDDDDQSANFFGADVAGKMLFSADDGVHGFEVWKTDGTQAGTVLVKDIDPGPDGSSPHEMIAFHGVLLFAAASTRFDLELWRSDGTEAGTVLVKDIFPGILGSFPQNLTEVNGEVLFEAYRFQLGADGTIVAVIPVLYRTDGTAAGTQALHEFGSNGFLTLGTFHGNLLVWANDGVHGFEIWKSDGTQVGTVLVKDINPGPADAFPGWLVAAGDKLFFTADDGVHGRELWTSDASEAGTRMVVDLTPGPDGSDTAVFGAGGLAYFVMADGPGINGARLWRSDGTAEGTLSLKSFAAVSLVGAALGGKLLFAGDDGIHGVELWRSDGTETGTVLVKDLNPIIRTNPSGTILLGAADIRGIGRRMFFTADDSVHGQELWVSDGTPQGTHLVKDIWPGPYTSSPSGGLAHDGAFYFGADDGVHGGELWRSDGTEAGTFMVSDINPGPESGSFPGLIEFQGQMYFVADDGIHGVELWKSDGTPEGTVLAVDIIPGPDGSLPSPVAAIGSTIFLIVQTPQSGRELWKSDGTPAGTVLVKDIAPGTAGSFPSGFVRFRDTLIFTANDGVHGREPWLSDGTEAGTRLLKDINLGSTTSRTSFPLATEAGGTLFFGADDGIHGGELWKTDGTEEGTVLVRNITPGRQGSQISSLATLNGTLFFTPIDPTSGDLELWKSDGTEEGTLPVAPGIGPIPYGLSAVSGGLLFNAWDDDHGYELWRSDGTTQGTVRAQDVRPGSDSSTPGQFIEMGDRVFFVADDGQDGEEPWVAHTSVLLGQPDRAIQDLTGEVTAMHMPKGLETSLLAKLDAAGKALAGHRTTEAILHLEVFSTHVDVLSPKWIPEEDAADLLEFASEIIELLDRPSPPAALSSRAKLIREWPTSSGVGARPMRPKD
jgi:ELWxxDGT repeat protein